MVCLSVLHGPEAQQAADREPPFGPGFDPVLVALATRLEVWGTTGGDPEGWTEFRPHGGDHLLDTRRITGY